MPPLSNAYHHRVLLDMLFQKKDPVAFRELVLSSHEMCLEFDSFMRTVKVYFYDDIFMFQSYCSGHYTINRKMRRGDGIRYLYWTAYFIRKIKIAKDPIDIELLMLDKIYRRSEGLKELKLYSDISLSSEVKNLISIAQMLWINEHQVEEIQSFIPRFETLIVSNSNFFKYQNKTLNKFYRNSKTLLLLYAEEIPFYKDTGVISRFNEAFKNLKAIYTIWNFQSLSMGKVINMIDSQWTLFPDTQNIDLNIFSRWHYSLKDFTRSYKKLIAKLRQTPESVRVKLTFDTYLAKKARRRLTTIPRFFTDDLFFECDPDKGMIYNPNVLLTENVEFIFSLYI